MTGIPVLKDVNNIKQFFTLYIHLVVVYVNRTKVAFINFVARKGFRIYSEVFWGTLFISIEIIVAVLYKILVLPIKLYM